MSLLFEKGTWTGDNSSPQTITLVDTSLTPVAIMAWTTGPGAAGSFSANAIFSQGFGTRRSGSTQSGCVGFISIDNVGTGDTARVRNTTILHVLSSTSATDYTVSLDSFGAGQFTVSYSSAANANGDIFHYCVWGGSDLTDANVLNWTMDATSGAEAITGVGFQPDMLFALDSDLATTDTITAALGYSFGMASSNTKYQAMAITATDADTMTSTMNWNCATRADACLERLLTNADTSDARWDLDTFDSDGASLGVVDAPSNTDRIATFLFLKGGIWEVGSKAKATTAVNDTFTLTNADLTPKGILLFNTRQTAVGVATARADFCIGASDGEHQGVAGVTSPEALNTTVDRFHATDACIEELTGGASPTETSTAGINKVTDNFNRADNADLGAEWTAVSGTGQFKIESNSAKSSQPAANRDEYHSLLVGNDQQAKAKVTVSGVTDQTGIGVGVRIQISNFNLYMAVVNKASSNNVTVAKVVASVYTLIGQRTTTWVDGDELTFSITGTTLRVYQNGTQLGADMTDSEFSSGRVGVTSRPVFTSGALDDWEGKDTTGFAQGSFVINWAVNGGSAALISYLAFGGSDAAPQAISSPIPLSGMRRRMFGLGR